MSAVLHLDDLRMSVATGGASRKGSLTIEADGALCLRAAEDVSTEERRQFLASKREYDERKQELAKRGAGLWSGGVS